VIPYGRLEKGDPRPLNGDTIFEIGSTTKVFTSLLLAGMVQRGEVALDDSGSHILAIQEVFGRMPRSRIALETGAHSLWVSRLLTQLGHEAIVAHARNVRLISESRRKDDRIDARTLARLPRIDPRLLSPVQHRSAKAQIHLTVIRARAGLVSARTTLVNTAPSSAVPQVSEKSFSKQDVRLLFLSAERPWIQGRLSALIPVRFRSIPGLAAVIVSAGCC
jgi:Beta-lactamase/Transposase